MKFVVAILAALAVCHVQAAPTVPSSLYSILSSQGTADIMIIMKGPTAPVLASINSRRFSDSGAKTTQLVHELREFTQAAQQPVLSFLSQRTQQQQVKPFWITNRISVKQASLPLVEDLIRNFGEQIAEIRDARVIYLDGIVPQQEDAETQVLEWGYLRQMNYNDIFLLTFTFGSE